jgi:hypothetical protein
MFPVSPNTFEAAERLHAQLTNVGLAEVWQKWETQRGWTLEIDETNMALYLPYRVSARDPAPSRARPLPSS